jgi:formate hydrogenlyase transcriptional activator
MPAMPSPRPESEPLNIQLLVDSIPALIHTARPDGYLDYFNRPWLEYLGVTLDKVAGWNWTAFIHPEELDGILAKWRGCLATGEIFEYETRVRRASGEYRWMFHRKVPLRDANGNIVKWYGSSLDIDERKTAEEQLRRNSKELQRSEYYLAEGQRLAHIGSWAFDPEGFYYWSPELFRMFGLDPVGKPPSVQEYLDYLHPHDRESMAHLIKGILAEISPFDATKRIVRPSGEVRYIRCVGAPVLENQSLKRYVGSAIDVTEHELLTERLRRREAYLAEAQALSHTGSWSWNPATGEPGYWSEECYRVLGFDPAGPLPLLETILQRIQPDEARAAVREQFERGIREKADIELEMSFVHPSKGIRNILSTGHAVVDTDGELREIVGTVIDITERKRAEEAVRRSEAYLAEAQRLSHTGSFGWKPDAEEIVWSNETYRIFECDPAEKPTVSVLLGRTHPQDRALAQQVIEHASKTGTDFEHEYRLLLPSGASKHVRALAQAFQDASGNLEFVGAVSDISEQRRAEAVIREQEAELREVVDTIPAVVWSALPDGSNSYANRRSVEYCGMTREQIAGSGWEAGFHPDDLERHKAKWLACVASGEPCEDEVRFRRADGQYRWHLQRGVPLRDEGGNIVKWYGVLTDIEDRKTAEGKIREQEAELRQIVDLAPQFVAVFGPDSERLYANRILLDHLGLTLEEWRQKFKSAVPSYHTEFVHPDDWERVTGYSARAVSKGSAFELEMRLRKSDGSYRWFLARYNPLHDEKGRITRWYVTGTDIEDRKQAEDRLQRENVALREEIDKTSMFEEIVGTSRPLKTVLSRVAKVAPTDSTVLITGETGTGKELVARAIHRRSKRSSRAFVSVNCSAIPRDLIASELFGHEKGAFTGALQRRLGRFELAEGGTIFLDEVGELPMETQIALLRVLQEREFDRVGGNHPIRADVRVIAATNRELGACVAAGSFRGDLFYRLNVFPIEIPPLRQRKDDIPILVEYFIDRYARKTGKKIKTIDKNTLELLRAYSWPGNIRELQNIIERSVIVCETETFSVDQSWLSVQSSQPQLEPASVTSQSTAKGKHAIEAALAQTEGRVAGPSGAAALLGVPASTLESKIRALKINKFRFKSN